MFLFTNIQSLFFIWYILRLIFALLLFISQKSCKLNT